MVYTSLSFLAFVTTPNLWHSAEDDIVSISPFLILVPVATGIYLPICSRKDSRTWNVPQQPTKTSFCFNHAWQRMRVSFSPPPWQREKRSNFLAAGAMRWKQARETEADCLIDLLHRNLSFESLFFFFFSLHFWFYLLKGNFSRLK